MKITIVYTTEPDWYSNVLAMRMVGEALHAHGGQVKSVFIVWSRRSKGSN